MSNIHDALDKALQQAEKEHKPEVTAPARNVYSEQVSAQHGVRHQINPELMRQRRIVTLNNYNSESESFRLLRTKILKQLVRIIGIISPSLRRRRMPAKPPSPLILQSPWRWMSTKPSCWSI